MNERYTFNEEQSQPVSLRNVLTVLFKRKHIILIFFITVVLVVTAGSFLMPKIYEAESKLLVEKAIYLKKAGSILPAPADSATKK